MPARTIAFGVLALLVAMAVLASSYIVEPGERGVRVTLGTMSDQFVPPGFGLKLPFVTEIRMANVQQARTDAETLIIKAKADAESISIQGQALEKTPRLVELKMVEKWNGVSPQVVGAGSNSLPRMGGCCSGALT